MRATIGVTVSDAVRARVAAAVAAGWGETLTFATQNGFDAALEVLDELGLEEIERADEDGYYRCLGVRDGRKWDVSIRVARNGGGA